MSTGSHPNPSGEPRWVFVLQVMDRPGAVSAVASVFAKRGVSMHAILGTDAGMVADGGRFVVWFSASPTRRDMLARFLRRQEVVETIEWLPEDDPRVRLIAMVRTAGPLGNTASVAGCSSEVLASSDDGATLLLIGSASSIRAALDDLRASGGLRHASLTALSV